MLYDTDIDRISTLHGSCIVLILHLDKQFKPHPGFVDIKLF